MTRRKHEAQFPGASPYRDRHGRRRWRYRVRGFSAELGTDYGSEEFIARYEAALRGERLRKNEGVGASRTRPGTVDALCVTYLRTPGYRALAPASKRREANEIERIRLLVGGAMVADFERRHIVQLVGERADTPASANHLLKMWRKLFKFAIEIGMRADNPARDVEMYRTSPDGFHTWTEEEIAAFFERHEAGTVAHTAVSLMLYTGAARVDACKLGWGNLRGARLVYRRQKTEGRSEIEIDIPIHEALAEVLARLPRDQKTFLATRTGDARSPNGLGNQMRKWCDAAGLPACSAHGLRKACARRLAEAGATAHEIMAVTGHATMKEAERYTRAAARSSMADRAMEKLRQAECFRASSAASAH